jgi:hypothetical protein
MANEVSEERWETGRGDGAGVYLAGSPATRQRIGDFGLGGTIESEVAARRAELAAAAPELLEALRITAGNLSTLNAARADQGIAPLDAWLAVVEAAIRRAEGA